VVLVAKSSMPMVYAYSIGILVLQILPIYISFYHCRHLTRFNVLEEKGTKIIVNLFILINEAFLI
jgi:hypothetical protein